MIKERPILFSAPMVRATLEGRKTQTRWAVKLHIPTTQSGKIAFSESAVRGLMRKSPYGLPGDRLWVRETWASEFGVGDDSIIQYRASGDQAEKWKPSIFMPRRASRITLEITAIRVERLQDISIADAVSEGVPCAQLGIKNDALCIAQYADIWESINGPGSWDANLWVWVIGFKRIQP